MAINKQSFVMGALILSASSIFVRIIGFLFRVYLSNTMGAEGIGVYSLIMSLYGLCATIATSGIATAVAKLAAEQLALGNNRNATYILKKSVVLSLFLSIGVAAVVFFFADQIALNMLKDSRTALSLKLLAPGIPFMSVASCLRGYFIAKRQMLNPASGQVIEQLVKMAFIAVLITYALPMGLEYGCAVIILGITIGEIVCFFYSMAGYLLDKKKPRPAGDGKLSGINREILKIIVPISLSSYIRSALRMLEDVLILSGFKQFMGQSDEATKTFGILRGMIMPLLIFPLSLLSAFVTTLTPEVSRLNAQNNNARLERTISKVLKYTCISGILIVVIFMTFSYELGVVIYKDPKVGDMLKMMSFLCPFMCVEMVVVGILQGLGQQVSSLAYSVSDCLLRVALVYFLIPISGVQGFVVMVIISNLYTSILNLRRLLKVTSIKLCLNEWIIKPTLAAITSGQIVRVVCNFYLFKDLPIWLGLAIGVGLVSLMYMLVLLSVGSVHLDDMNWITQRLGSANKPPKAAAELIV